MNRSRMKPKAGRKYTGKNEKQKLKSIGIELPGEIGRVCFVSKYSPYLFKKNVILKSIYGAVFIAVMALISVMSFKNHTQTYWDGQDFLGLFMVYFFVTCLFICIISKETFVKAVGMYGFCVFTISFGVKSMKKRVVLFKDIENFCYNRGGDGWWVRGGNPKYHKYTITPKNNDDYILTIYDSYRDNDDLDFMIHILKNWYHSARYLPEDKIHGLIGGLERLKY